MLYIFGDSHANFNFKNLMIPHTNVYSNSVTMHRIARDKEIINFHISCNNKDSIFILHYGEVDARCHIGKQLLLGRQLEEICENLVSEYIHTIREVIQEYNKIIMFYNTTYESRII